MKLKLILITSALLMISACAPSRGHVMLINYLDKGIGVYTYEDVVKRWHSADEMIEGKETFTGIWIREDEIYPGYVGPPYQTPSIYGEKKTLVFDKERRILKSYHVEYY